MRGKGLIAGYMPPDQAGARWRSRTRTASCAARRAPDTLWVQHHSGVFRSTDAGATWTQIKPPGDDFGFAVAVHPRDRKTAWFVPAIKDELRMPRDGALCVHAHARRRQDLGERCAQGLPQRDAFDLVYRHGLDVDETGARLAMGSTTGALWVSDDGGERWQLVNAHLPPIYAVRFGVDSDCS